MKPIYVNLSKLFHNDTSEKTLFSIESFVNSGWAEWSTKKKLNLVVDDMPMPTLQVIKYATLVK